MPIKRRIPKARVDLQYTDVMRTHFEIGDCLLASPGPGERCFCGLVGPDGGLRREEGRRLWRKHRAEILRDWRKPEPPWAAQEFDNA
jgi:hypothetical protein